METSQSTSQFLLNDLPDDSISSLKFIPNSSDLLLVSSWDGVARLYDLNRRKCLMKTEEKAPLMACAPSKDRAFYGGLDCSVYMTELGTRQTIRIGEHMDAVRCVEYSEFTGLIVTGSWDASVMLWDVRTSELIGNYHQPNEVFCMSVKDEILVVGTAGKIVCIWDLRNMKVALAERSSKLPTYQTRCVKIFPDKKRYTLGTIEGRVSIEPISPDVSANSTYAFKPHYDKSIDVGHPVNAISFHEPTSFFATGASDARVQLWDGDRKKRVYEFSSYPASIAAMDFCHDGSFLAVGCSYLHDLTTPPDPMPLNSIYIRPIKPGSFGANRTL